MIPGPEKIGKIFQIGSVRKGIQNTESGRLARSRVRPMQLLRGGDRSSEPTNRHNYAPYLDSNLDIWRKIA